MWRRYNRSGNDSGDDFWSHFDDQQPEQRPASVVSHIAFFLGVVFLPDPLWAFMFVGDWKLTIASVVLFVAVILISTLCLWVIFSIFGMWAFLVLGLLLLGLLGLLLYAAHRYAAKRDSYNPSDASRPGPIEQQFSDARRRFKNREIDDVQYRWAVEQIARDVPHDVPGAGQLTAQMQVIADQDVTSAREELRYRPDKNSTGSHGDQ